MKDNGKKHNTNGHDNTQQKSYYHKTVMGKLRIIPLGGLGEIGKNMTALEYEDDIIIIDCGLTFPDESMPGVDSVIPQTKYLEDNRRRIKGMFITHGHLDHSGAIPYIWPKLKCPIYTGKLTAAMIEEKIKEFPKFPTRELKINIVSSGQKFRIGVFDIETIGVSHTIPDEMGMIIDTPVGRFVYVVDFRFDFGNPEEREIFKKLSALGKTNVRCLFLDSTGAEVEGQTVSEVKVKESIDSIFRKTKGRIIVTSFASNLDRIQAVFDAAKANGRRVALAGRSMEQAVRIASEIGYLKAPQGLVADLRHINSLPDSEIVILCTGSQGEEYAALVRMASGDHKQIKIKPGDTIVLSSSVVPGNERSVADTINSLFYEGAEVIYGGEAMEIHASGHAKADELKIMISMIRPEYFIPIHGEYRHLVRHAQIAQSLGIDPKKILVMSNGEVAEFSKDEGQLTKEKVPSGYVFVDGLGVGDVGNIVIRDRQAMAKDGIFVVILTVDHENGKIVTSPDIISRGFVYMRAREDLIQKARNEIRKMFTYHNEKYPANWDQIKRMIRDELGEFLYKETQRRPMVIPVIIEV